MTIIWFILILALCCAWTAVGVLIASYFANMYAFMNFESPPAWKVYLVIAIWPVTILSVVYSSIRERMRKRI